MGDQGLIVVGVDGSESARTALEFALEEAARRGARVRAVVAFPSPQLLGFPVGYGMASPRAVPPSAEELGDAADRTGREAVAQATADGAAEVPLEVRAVEGHPAQVLVDESAGADLLVVGHRGLGGFASACLGSVGLQCVLHATCPVTVVRPVAAAGAREPVIATAGRAT